MDRTLARVKREFSEKFQITRLPGRNSLAHTTILRIEVFRPTGKSRRHRDTCLLESRLRNIPQKRLVKRLQRLLRIRQHIPRCRLTLKHPQVVVRVHQTSRKAGEEDTDLKRRHLRVPLDDAPIVRVAIQEQQPVLPAQCDARLIQQTIVQTDILALRLRGNLHHLKRLQRDLIRLRKRHHIRDQHGSTRRQATHRQRALNDTRDTPLQLKPLPQSILRTPGIVTPMALLHLRRRIDLKIHYALKGPRLQVHMPLWLGGGREPQVHPFIDRKTRHQPMLMIHMRPQGTHPIRRKNMILICFHVCKGTNK